MGTDHTYAMRGPHQDHRYARALPTNTINSTRQPQDTVHNEQTKIVAARLAKETGVQYNTSGSMGKHHGKDNVCPFCDKHFDRRWNLKIHVRRHINYTPFPCGICKKGYVTATTRRAHEKVCGSRMRHEQGLHGKCSQDSLNGCCCPYDYTAGGINANSYLSRPLRPVDHPPLLTTNKYISYQLALTTISRDGYTIKVIADSGSQLASKGRNYPVSTDIWR